MATVDTGPLGTLTFISVAGVDPDATGTDTHIRVRYSLDTTSATEALTGFAFWHDDESGSTTPVWIDAPSAGLGGSGDGATPTEYECLVEVPFTTSTVATWWETFKEYATGAVGTMSYGGASWGGDWMVAENEIGWHNYQDDFQSYPAGAVGILNGGTGWSAAWVIGANG